MKGYIALTTEGTAVPLVILPGSGNAVPFVVRTDPK
jgi:hypothetical protein